LDPPRDPPILGSRRPPRGTPPGVPPRPVVRQNSGRHPPLPPGGRGGPPGGPDPRSRDPPGGDGGPSTRGGVPPRPPGEDRPNFLDRLSQTVCFDRAPREPRAALGVIHRAEHSPDGKSPVAGSVCVEGTGDQKMTGISIIPRGFLRGKMIEDFFMSNTTTSTRLR
jgi:hypothetical protein